jgi:hypothetical protein
MKIFLPLSANSLFLLLLLLINLWFLYSHRGIKLTAPSSHPSPLGGGSSDVHQRGHFLLHLELLSVHPSDLSHLELDV